MAEIVGQSEYYGLPSRPDPIIPSAEKIADLLRPAPLWEGPGTVDRD